MASRIRNRLVAVDQELAKGAAVWIALLADPSTRSASTPGDCRRGVRVIMVGRTLARPTERVDPGQQRKVWRWSSE
jgi:hypothetical protein